MSTTTTATTRTNEHFSILADYEIHHSENAPEPAPASPSSPAQPVDWPSDHRRMPPYRPVNRQLDWNERPAGSNPAEFVFIQAMLHGVWLNASIARLWRFTGGRISDRIFRYDVGGEY